MYTCVDTTTPLLFKKAKKAPWRFLYSRHQKLVHIHYLFSEVLVLFMLIDFERLGDSVPLHLPCWDELTPRDVAILIDTVQYNTRLITCK